jgi:hypothetical protein
MADLFCLQCGGWNPPGSRFCRHCAAPLAVTIPPPVPAPTSPTPPAPARYDSLPPPAAPLPFPDPDLEKARERTVTGLLLLALGSGLAWIPFISALGGIIILIGLLFMFLGRNGFGATHRRYVLVGGAIFLIAGLVAVIVTLDLVTSIVNTGLQNPNDPLALRSALESELNGYIIALAIVGLISLAAQAIVAYDLGDATSRSLLVLGVVLAGVVSILSVYLELTLLPAAIDQSTSGSTLDLGPITDLQNQIALYGLIRVFPYLALAWGYARTRELLRREADRSSTERFGGAGT